MKVEFSFGVPEWRRMENAGEFEGNFVAIEFPVQLPHEYLHDCREGLQGDGEQPDVGVNADQSEGRRLIYHAVIGAQAV